MLLQAEGDGVSSRCIINGPIFACCDTHSGGGSSSVTEVEAAVAELLNESVHLVDLAVFSVEFLLTGAASPSQLADWRETKH